MRRFLILLGLLGVLGAAAAPALAQQQVVPGYLYQPPNGNSQAFLNIAAFLYKNITGDATLVVKSGVGVLHSLTFNAPTATETVTLYDNTAGSGTKIGTITVPSSPQPVTLLYDVLFTNGLTIVTATATSDITVSYQ